MTQRHLSESLKDLYATVKAYQETGRSIPTRAVPLLMKVALTARLMAEELEEELALAERIIASRKPPANAEGNVVRMPCRPRLLSSPSDGGDAA